MVCRKRCASRCMASPFAVRRALHRQRCSSWVAPRLIRVERWLFSRSGAG
jgi:hypothetical protein